MKKIFAVLCACAVLGGAAAEDHGDARYGFLYHIRNTQQLPDVEAVRLEVYDVVLACCDLLENVGVEIVAAESFQLHVKRRVGNDAVDRFELQVGALAV